MPRVLGIDTSLTATGLARVDVKPAPEGTGWPPAWEIDVATVGAPKPTADKSRVAMARRVNALIRQVESAITAGYAMPDAKSELPDLIALEGLAFAARGEGAWVLPWVFGRVVELAERYDIPLIVVGTSQRAKYATGKGNADKDTVMLAAARRWPEAQIANNNEADAMVVAAVGCHYLGYPLTPPTQAQAEVLAKVTH